MAEKIQQTITTTPIGQVQTGNNSLQVINNSAVPQQTTLSTNNVNLKKLSQSTNSTPKTVTVEDIKQQRLDSEKKALRNKSMTAMTLAGGSFSAFAGLSKMFLGEDSALAKALDGLTNKVSALTFTGFGAFGSRDSVKRNYLPQVIPQVLGMITPWLVKSEDLTMYRGVEVGLANVAADIEKLGGGKKQGYQDFGESINVFKAAASKYAQAMKENPLNATLNYESGTAGITTGLVTALSPLVHLLGLKKAAALLRQGSGIAVEFASKFNMDNLNKGRYALFASGGLMTVSSFLNLVKEFLPQKTHKAVENFTWAFNLFGKQAQLQAYNNGEMALTEKQNHKLEELPGKMLRAVLGQTNQSESMSASSTKQTEVKLNAHKSSNAHTSLRMPSVRQSFVPRASLAATRSTPIATSSNSAYNTAASQVSYVPSKQFIQASRNNFKAISLAGEGNSFKTTATSNTSTKNTSPMIAGTTVKSISLESRALPQNTTREASPTPISRTTVEAAAISSATLPSKAS